MKGKGEGKGGRRVKGRRAKEECVAGEDEGGWKKICRPKLTRNQTFITLLRLI